MCEEPMIRLVGAGAIKVVMKAVNLARLVQGMDGKI